MQTPFPFETVIIFGWLASMLIIGIVLRAKIPLFQRYLLPSCLIGGIIGFIIINTKTIKVSVSDLETFAYHFFNISFISLGLTGGEQQGKKSILGKDLLRGSLWMALVQGSTFGLQAALSGLLVLIFGLVGLDLFATFGFLLPLGFEEGPGQALSIGKVWESLGFEHAATIGLTFASIGFGFAFFVGVPLVNWGIRKGLASRAVTKLSEDLVTGIVPEDMPKESAGQLTLHPGNVDSLAFQAALVGLVYLLTYFMVKFTAGLLAPDSAKIIWGFFFVFGLFVAILMRTAARFLGRAYLIDPGIQRRVTGWSVDFLIVSTVMAIQLPVVWKYILPISILSIVAGTLTTMVVFFLGKRLPQYNLERTAAVYGAVTGTVSTGLLLLRISDPDFRTPVAIEIAIMNLFSIPIIGACLVLVNAPVWWNLGVGLTSLIFFGVTVVCLVFLRVLKFIGTPKF
jgi:ESS family glutamate:Na+ symporter